MSNRCIVCDVFVLHAKKGKNPEILSNRRKTLIFFGLRVSKYMWNINMKVGVSLRSETFFKYISLFILSLQFQLAEGCSAIRALDGEQVRKRKFSSCRAVGLIGATLLLIYF